MTKVDLADRFLNEAAQQWAAKGLPLTDLASAAVTWGLRIATAESSPSEVVEGLQRIADAISCDPSADIRPRHLI